MLVDDIGVCIVLSVQFKAQPTLWMCITYLITYLLHGAESFLRS
jgi:hypothetical protein